MRRTFSKVSASKKTAIVVAVIPVTLALVAIACLFLLRAATDLPVLLMGFIASQVEVRPTVCFGAGSLVPGSYHTEAIVKYSRGFVVLYTAQCVLSTGLPGPSPIDLEGDVVFEQRGLTWSALGGGASGNSTSSSGGSLSYMIGTSAGNDGYTIISGRIHSSRVVSIEATFGNGEVLQARPINGRFAIVASEAAIACELKAFDSDGTQLDHYDLDSMPWARLGATGSCTP
jgi:hypothetical protein